MGLTRTLFVAGAGAALAYFLDPVSGKERRAKLRAYWEERSQGAAEVVDRFGRTHEMLDMPNLIEIQLKSFDWFKQEGLRELFAEISPIGDFTGKNLELELAIGDEPLGPPK